MRVVLLSVICLHVINVYLVVAFSFVSECASFFRWHGTPEKMQTQVAAIGRNPNRPKPETPDVGNLCGSIL